MLIKIGSKYVTLENVIELWFDSSKTLHMIRVLNGEHINEAYPLTGEQHGRLRSQLEDASRR